MPWQDWPASGVHGGGGATSRPAANTSLAPCHRCDDTTAVQSRAPGKSRQPGNARRRQPVAGCRYVLKHVSSTHVDVQTTTTASARTDLPVAPASALLPDVLYARFHQVFAPARGAAAPGPRWRWLATSRMARRAPLQLRLLPRYRYIEYLNEHVSMYRTHGLARDAWLWQVAGGRGSTDGCGWLWMAALEAELVADILAPQERACKSQCC